MFVKIRNLTKIYNNFCAVNKINFQIEKNKTIGLLGPNGCGKTTTIGMMLGLVTPTEGEILIDTDNFIFAGETNGIKTSLTVSENLRFWSAIFGGKEFEEALEVFHLTKFENRFAGKLSAGQKRRLSLARLMLADKAIWLLDEPTVSLDKKSMEEFSKILKNHLEAGGAAVVATHIDLGLKTHSSNINIEDYRTKSGNLNASAGAF